MSSIIEQIADIFKSGQPSDIDAIDPSWIYDEDTSKKLDELIPEFLDTDRVALLSAIKHVLKIDIPIEFRNNRLRYKTKQSSTASSFAQEIEALKEIDSLETKPDDSALSEKYAQAVGNLVIPMLEVLQELGLENIDVTNDVKDTIRGYLREKINLYEKDLILFLNKQVLIKKFNRDAEVKQEERFNGLPPQELNILRAKTFDSLSDEEKFVAETMQKAMAVDLNFAVISGDAFQKNYVKRIQKHLETGLQEKLNEDSFVIEGLVNLILRENWIFAHKMMAKKILDLVGDKVSGAEMFLRYFKGDTVLGEDGFRYRLPEIIDINGTKWSASMIFGMVVQQKKARLHKQELELASKELKAKIEECRSKISSVEKETSKAEDDIIDTEREMVTLCDADKEREISMKDINIRLQTSSDLEETQGLKAKYMELMGEAKRSVSKEYGLKSKKRAIEDILQTSGTRINKLHQEMANAERKIKEEEAKINKFVLSLKTLNEKYGVMQEALISALMRKRSKVTEVGS